MKRTRVGIGSGAMGRTALAKLSTRYWMYPLVGAMVVAVVGFWAMQTLTSSLHDQVRHSLEALLEADKQALTVWLEGHEDTVEVLALDDRVRKKVEDLVAMAAKGATPQQLAVAKPLEGLRKRARTLNEVRGLRNFAVVAPDGTVVGASKDEHIGLRVLTVHDGAIKQAFAGQTVFMPPHMRQDDDGLSVVTMVVATGVRDDNGAVIGVLGFGLDPDAFTAILGERAGESGESYAFNEAAQLISYSRFEDQLRSIGLLEGEERSLLNVSLRDPGGNMVEGYRPEVSELSLPLTVMAGHAIARRTGSNVDGYNDYRGVPVVGAWTWLDEYGIGIATEIDEDEAFGVLTTVRMAFWVLILMLLVGSASAFLVARRVFRLRRKVSEAMQLGQYTLHEMLGSGAMGEVYRASHAMLRRPTAIKLLRAEGATEQHIARFEREVQLTSRLTHPNTISIYDYGRSPDGTFYYAMELLPGVSLDKLVADDGPLPDARVVHILRQAASSLAEAHEIGLIHRDIKPPNIMICERGGLYDTVKVLDFGLVKALDAGDTQLTLAGKIIGTPLYLSPEAIRKDSIDGRSDLYSLGAVAYFLVTGEHVFEPASVGEVLTQHLNDAPVPPTQRAARDIHPRLETLILRCLAKEPGERPRSAGELVDMLDKLARTRDIGEWSQEDARNASGTYAKAAAGDS